MEDTQHSDSATLLLAAQPFDTALYLGPGLRALAQSLSGRHAKRLIAFTDVKAHRSFSTQGAGELDIVTQPALVTPSGKETGIHSYNVQGFNSLRPATRLKEIFPGLREGPQIPVETITLSTALEQAGLKGSGNLLILGTNGYEADILQALAQSDSLSLFSRIILPLPSLPFYENSKDGTSLAAMMEAHCYRHGGKDPSDPDMPIAAFDLDRARLADRAALAERDRDIAVLADRLDRLTGDLKEVQAQRDTAQRSLADSETARDAAKVDAEGRAATLATLQAEHAADRKALTSLRSEHEATRTKVDELESSLGAAKTERDSAVKELAEAWGKAKELEQQFETLKAGQEKASQETDIIRQAKAKSEEDLTLALRLQGLREADLVELKERYQSLKKENDHISDLLRTTLHTLDFLRGQKRGGKKAAKRT